MEGVEFDEKAMKHMKIGLRNTEKASGKRYKSSMKMDHVKRDLVNPDTVYAHCRGSYKVPIFSRDDLKVNTIKLDAECIERPERPLSKTLFKKFYNVSDKAYPSTSREHENTSSPQSRDDEDSSSSSSSESSDSSENRSESRRSKSCERMLFKLANDTRSSNSPKYIRSSSSRSREYSKSKSPSYKRYKYSSSRRKSSSPKRRRSPDDYSKSKKYSRGSEKRRSQTPLRPGEYRPPKHHHRSPSTSSRKSPALRPGEYRPTKHRQRSSPTHRSKSPPLRPGEYRPPKHRQRSPKSRSKSPPLRPGEYRPSKHRQRSSTTHRSKSPSTRRSKSPSTRRSKSPPLRPGEYRPPKHRQRSPSLRPGEYRPKRHRSRSPDDPRSSAVGYLHHPAPHGHYESFVPPPHHMMTPRYMQDMFRSNGPILVPHIQYIPVPQPMMPPMRHHTIVRPPKIYNNRPIPVFNPPVKNEAPTAKKTEEKKDDSSK